jgi:hypothetical protein
MPTMKLSFVPTELSATAKSFLEQRFMQEDYKSYWCSLESVLEDIAQEDTIFTGVKLAGQLNWEKVSLKDLPAGWWKLMKFSPKVEKAMKAHWKKYPTGHVVWEW